MPATIHVIDGSTIIQVGENTAATIAARADAVAARDVALAVVNFRATRAAGVADFAVGEFFASAETGELRVYQRTGSSPFYVDQGDAAAPLSKTSPEVFRQGQRAGFFHHPGPISIGDHTVLNRSFDPIALKARRVVTATDNFHVDSNSWVCEDLAGYSTAEYDGRGIVTGGNGNHIVAGVQAATEWASPDTLTDWYAMIGAPIVSNGTVTRATGIKWTPVVSGSGTITQHRIIDGNGLAEYTNPGAPSSSNTNYLLINTGGARISTLGQAHFAKLFIGATEGVANKPLHVFSVSGTEAIMRLQQDGHNTLDISIPANSIDGKLTMNNLDQLVFDYQTALLPGAASAFNLGSASVPWNNGWITTAWTVTSDARLKKVRGPITDAEMAWAAAIEPLAYQMTAAVAEKGEDARLHWGVLAQAAHDAGVAAGVPDPFAHGFLCRDEKFERRETGTRPVERQRIDKVSFVEMAVEIVDGEPREVERTVEREVPATERKQVIGLDGKPKMQNSTRPILEPVKRKGRPVKGDDGRPVMRQVTIDKVPQWHPEPVMYEVPVLERVEEPVVERVRALDENGEPDFDWSIRYEELLMFLYAALRERVRRVEAT